MKTPRCVFHLSALITAVTFIVACGPSLKQRVAATLDDVESYINERPDSALAVLEKVDSTALSTRAIRARCSLLHVMALDKCYKDITAPGLLDEASEWYEHHGTADEKMKVLYYQGRIAQDCKDQNSAAVYYMRAEEYSEDVVDKHALGVLYMAEATIFNTVHNIEKEKEFTEKGLSVFRSIDDPMQDIALGQLAISYFSLRNWERADSLFRKGIASSSSNPYAQSVFLSNYARMKVLQPEPEPNVALALLDRKQKDLGQKFSLQDAGAYAYALTLLGRAKEAEGILNQLEKLAATSPMTVEKWLSRCAFASGDYEQAYISLNRTHLSEESVIQETLSDSVLEAISAYNNMAAGQKRMQYRINMAVLTIILLFLLLLLTLSLLRKNKIESERSRILDLYSTLEREAADQENNCLELQRQLNNVREIARKERVLRFRQAGRLRSSIWRLDHLGMPTWFTKDQSILSIKEELSYVYDIDDSADKLVRRLDRELDGIIIPLLERLNLMDKPKEQLFLCCCLLEIPTDIIASKLGITPNNVRVKKYRLKDQIAKLNNADYDSLFAIRR